MTRTAIASSVLLLAIGASPAAMAAEGFYLGGAVQQSHFDSSEFDVEDIDNDDHGWKIISGIRFTPHFALEGTYTDFGKENAPSVAVGGPFEADAKAWSAFGVALFPLGPVDLFAKGGVSRIDSDGNVGAVFYDDHDTVLAYGAGLQFRFGNLALRTDYEKFDTDVVGDLDVLSVGLTYTFSSGSR